MTRLVSLAYLSRASTEEIDTHVLDDILASSQSNNITNDITGAVAYGDGRFIQVLEGPEPAILATLARIERDERHHSLQVVGPEPIEKRLFPDWCMARLTVEPHLKPAWQTLISEWSSQGSNAAKILSKALEI